MTHAELEREAMRVCALAKMRGMALSFYQHESVYTWSAHIAQLSNYKESDLWPVIHSLRCRISDAERKRQ